MRRTAALALAGLLLTAACATDPADSQGDAAASSAALAVPQEAADIIGTVETVSDAGAGRVALIRQIPERSAGYPAATITIGEQTVVLRRSGERMSRARAADLAAGTRVHAWFTGPVRESLPVQADARLVLIVD